MHSFLNVKYALIKSSLNLLLVLVLNLPHLPYIAVPAELGDKFVLNLLWQNSAAVEWTP